MTCWKVVVFVTVNVGLVVSVVPLPASALKTREPAPVEPKPALPPMVTAFAMVRVEPLSLRAPPFRLIVPVPRGP